MFILTSVSAIQEFFATSFRRRTIAAGCAVAFLSACGQSANAQVIQDSLQDPFAESTGVFEWDNFATTFSPTADAQESGIGVPSLTLSSVAQPMDGPPVAIVTSTNNIYTGGTITEFSAQVSELNNTEANTTVVLQVSAIGSFSGFELNGQAPTEFLDRGLVGDVGHGSGAAPFDTTFYWAEWQLDNVMEIEITFANTQTHQSLAGIRIDYVNSSSITDVTAPDVLSLPTLMGDVNLDSEVNFLDISTFISILSTSDFQAEADMDGSGEVDFLDISPFISVLSGS